MQSLLLSEIAAWLSCPRPPFEARLAGISTDTRQLRPGELFVALEGKRFDGHDFVGEAEARGAAAAVVQRRVPRRLTQLHVPDTCSALGRIAGQWRRKFAIPVAAVAGSNGKTTVKEMLHAIAARAFPRGVLATVGNLNNQIGVPLTLLRMRERHRFAVVEIGGSRPGEIGPLAKLVKPDVAVITNAGLDHLSGFGSPAGAARANGEIFPEMPLSATAVLNADDRFFPVWERLAAERRKIRFSLDGQRAEVTGTWTADGRGGRLRIASGHGSFETALQLPGRHNGANALAAAATALAAGLSPESIAAGLRDARPLRGRLTPRPGPKGTLFLDDTYNANPSSLTAALAVLAEYPGDKILVLGDMAELGVEAVALHTRAGREARAAGILRLLAIGDLSRHAALAFGPGAAHFHSPENLLAALHKHMHPGMTILFKGSRCMHVEHLVGAPGVASPD